MQFGDYFDDNNEIVPSKILIFDLENGSQHWLDNQGWSPSAHIDWDPVDDNVFYLSFHNGVITPVNSRVRFFFEKRYKWKLFGPAAILKFKVTKNGVEKLDTFEHPDLYRLTIHKVFLNQGEKTLACTGFPNYLFIADAHTMKWKNTIELKEDSGEKSILGSMFPSPDGEKIFAGTTRSLQIVDVASGTVDNRLDLGRLHDPFNHMTSVADTAW